MQDAGLYGTNAVAFKFKNGVIAGVDTAVTYGQLSIPNIQRVFKATDNCAVVFTGLIADIQFLVKFIKQEIEADEGRTIDPQGIHKMLQRILYQKRSEAKPMRASAIVCGINKKKNEIFESTDSLGRVLGVVNSKGNFWFDNNVSLSFSSNFVLPILREKDLENMERSDAIKLMEECFRIMCYEDCRSSNSIQIAIIEPDSFKIFEPYCIKTDWMVGKEENEILLQ